jgi:hypothetical protein
LPVPAARFASSAAVNPDDLRILIDMDLVEMRDDVLVVTPAGDAEIT